jgi:signal transduction histidine kinase
MSEAGRVLIVDDDGLVRAAHARVLIEHGYEVDTVADAESALVFLRETAYDAALLDVSMPGMGGIELTRALRAEKIDTPLALVTGSADLETAIEAMDLGVLRLLRKPVTPRVLVRTTHEIIRLRGVARAEKLALDNAALRALVDELTRARTAADAAFRAKKAFLAMMSHELRTPMTAVVGYTDLLLLDSGISEAQRSELKRVQGASAVMLRLLKNLLTLADLAGGVEHTTLAPFDVRSLLAELLPRFAQIAEEKGLYLCADVASHVPASIFGDGPRFALVVEQLLDNALKFTAQGRVDLRIEVLSSDDFPMGLRATVDDTGVGIDRERLARVREAFTQGDESLHRSHGGAGLGLAIASALARLLDGSLALDSTVGVGTHASVVIPIQRVGAA